MGKTRSWAAKKGQRIEKYFFPLGATVDKAKSPFFFFFRCGGGDREFYTVSTGKEGGERNEESSRRGKVGIKVCSSGWE